MTPPKDDLEAVRAVVAALEGIDSSDQERILRWAREKIGLPVVAVAVPQSVRVEPPSQTPSGGIPASPSLPSPAKNLKTFVEEKKPKSDVQFAATVAYFHRFEEPQGHRKNEVTSKDLEDACRLANRHRLHNPGQTLLNAHKLGLLDRVGRGTFAINSVGENLVAMILPGDGMAGVPGRAQKNKRAERRKTSTKKAKK